MKFRLFLYGFFMIVCMQQLAAQEQSDLNIIPADTTFISHEVKAGETIFSLSEKYQVSQKDLIAVNPELLFGLKPGSFLRIPVMNNEAFTEYIVKKKQTVFSIARRYRITLDELYRYNPQARKGIQAGQKLRIPLEMNASGKVEPVSTEEVVEEQIVKEIAVAPKVTKRAGYFTHKVAAGETIFDLERRYGMSADSLIALNPAISKGLTPGLKLRIPIDRVPEMKSEPENESEFIRYRVAEGETIYSLADLFQVRVAELKAANPELKYRTVLTGEELLIPDKRLRMKRYDDMLQDTVWASPQYRLLDNLDRDEIYSQVSGKKYQVALLLPLYLNSNDTVNRVRVSKEELLGDSLSLNSMLKSLNLPKDTFQIRADKVIDPRSENFMHFYEGVLLAVDSLNKRGLSIELHVFDTRRDSSTVLRIIRQESFLNMDLIIGPVFPEQQRAVSAYSAKNRIPMVSPLSAAGSFEKWNPYYFKVNPTKEKLISKTAEWFADEFFNARVFVLKMGDYKHLPEASLVEQCRNRLNETGYYLNNKEVLFREYDASKEGFRGLTYLLTSRRQNVFIVPASSEGQVSVAVTNLNTMAEKYPIRLIGLPSFKNYKSIQPEYYHQVQLEYLAHYFTDYESLPVNQFIGKFRKQFGTEPNEFSFQGFDVAYYFMTALHQFGKQLITEIPGFNLPLNQLNLDFQRVSKTGGFMNEGLFDVCYQKDFSIKNNGLVNPENLK